jgi:PTH2 family peptidyl-tRNA hydrolase
MTKQIIVVRKDLNMRKGKLAAQVAHASMSFITRRFEFFPSKYSGNYHQDIVVNDVEKEWLENSFTKICVSVDSEQELDEIYNKAKEAGLETHLITDNGKTEFHGIPTKTCVALGPDYSEKLDPITGHLKLL